MKNIIIKKCVTILLLIIAICFNMNKTILASNCVYRYKYFNFRINGKLYSYVMKMDCIINNEKTEEKIDEKIDEYSFKDKIYYCNTSLKNSLKIDENIKQKVLSLTNGEVSDFNKAKRLYEFVSSHISYDYERYNIILNRGNMCNWQAGALYSYYSRKGVCFEYATLFASMARAAGLKVRILYGDSHVWNEIYDRQSNRWISVDATWKEFNFNVNNYHAVYYVHAEL